MKVEVHKYQGWRNIPDGALANATLFKIESGILHIDTSTSAKPTTDDSGIQFTQDDKIIFSSGLTVWVRSETPKSTLRHMPA